MFKKIITAIAIVFIAGCSYPEDDPLVFDQDQVDYFCIGGVLYYHLPRAMAVAYNIDGTIKLCGGE